MFRALNNRKAFASFIGLLLSIVIVVFVAYMVFKVYLAKPSVDQQTQKTLSEQGISTSSPKTILDSTRATLKGIEKQTQQREDSF
ncbi:MAG TPA: hypothetical protein PL155_06535 [Candidatus Omnitrophota bacterium]|nr:hypothetical protein [Candidatus Omnitrophota bacterium]HPD83864.1 hypothetical protein [Candidatus Omnitrophota bacterium]HRZ02721.1 hypothetical protein [Candidatus Omnitrophota bacterium]